MDRKNFIKSTMLLGASAVVSPLVSAGNTITDSSKSIRSLKKGIGFDMIKEDLSILGKFKLVKDLGFDGIEFNTPTELNKSEIIKAKEKTGIELPSVINCDHWKKPLSDPDPEIREECILSIAQSLQDVKDFGGDTVLVVPGVVNEKVSYDQAYHTSIDSIRKLIPYVEKTGIQIALENVWNNFILSPIEAKRFVDEINHPLIGWYFDIGNILRYGWPEQWMTVLNRRIMKLHIKEFSRKKMNNEGLYAGFKVKLTDGDINWPLVMKTVKTINYKGEWIRAEVSGGDRNRLKDISERMDKILSYL